MITGVVLAHNEERNIVDCLRSLRPHVRELLLIDMESTDRTVELSQPLITRILRHPNIPHFDAARNVAVPEASYDWLWFLDADERVPAATGHLVNRLVRERGEQYSAITIPFKSYFCGKWIRHCGWWPGYTMARVLKRGHFRFSDQLHSGVHFEGAELRLPPAPEMAIEHFSYRSIEHYLEKFNRYTSLESDQLAAHGQSLNWEAAFRNMVRDWWQYYEALGGVHEGQHGWILSWLAGQYRWFSHAKLLDRRERQVGYHVVPSLDAIIDVIHSEVARQRAAQPQLPLGVVWRSPVWDASGYAEDSRVLLKSLALADRPVTVQDIHWSDHQCPLADSDVVLLKLLCRSVRPKYAATITNCIASLVQPDPDAALNILRTTFETDRIPPEWVPVTDDFDEVWVFSEYNRTSFQRGGVAPEKLRVLGSFVDTNVFTSRGRKRKPPMSMANRFVFLSVFDWQFRKGWDVLLRAYAEEFTPTTPVGLLLKTTRWHGHGAELIRKQMQEVLALAGYELDERPDIEVLDEALDTQELAALYRSANAFVLASRGEGWGRPYMEAMACGLPTIGTRGSGNMDFMNDENSFLVEVQPVRVSGQAAEEIPVYHGHWWLEPDVASLRAKLRLVYKNASQRRRAARRGAADMRAKYDVRLARVAVEENLRQAEQRFLTPKLPNATLEDIKVVLEGELFAGHSFANINEKLTRYLGATPGIALSFQRKFHNPTHDRQAPHASAIKPFISRPLGEGPQITIRHAFPPNWNSPEHGKWVHIQPWEYGSLPLDWVEPLRDQVDEIWAPSNYVGQVYARSGVPAHKIHVIPWGISPEVFHPFAPSRLLPTEKSFRFLFVGGTVARKGIDRLLDAFCREFTCRDDVCLVIKDMGVRSFYRHGNYRDQIQQLIDDPAAPEIIYFDQPMTEGQLAGLYTACNCLVSPYRGEGFGLPILEAMACGLASITTRGGASDDFVDERCGYLINAHEVECTHGWRLCGIPTELAIDTDDLRHTMRHAYEQPEQTQEIGARASAHVRGNYTWANTAEQMACRLQVLAGSAEVVRFQTKPAQRATLSLCVVFRNDEQPLADCLGRLRPFVDEIIAIDVGSQDNSHRVAQEYGARVYQQTWEESFGRAKNLAIVRATCDWIICLDPQDQIDDPPARHLASMLSSLDRDVIGVNVRYHHGSWIEQRTQIFRNQNDVFYELRVGENVRRSIERLGGRIADLDVEVRRGWPVCEDELKEQLRLSHVDLAENRGDPDVLLSLGQAHFRGGNFFHAECYLHEFLSNSGPQHPCYLNASKLLISAHRRKGDFHRALEVASAASQYFPGERELESPRLVDVPVITPPQSDLRKLYLGAGQKRLAGYTHVDIRDGKGIDVVHDLNRAPWPWQDESVSIIVAEDVVEHLEIDLLTFCDEAWRVLAPHGELFVRTPHHQGDSSFIDPTHRWHLNGQSFEYLDPDREWGRIYSHYTERKWKILSLGVRGPQNIHALMTPRK